MFNFLETCLHLARWGGAGEGGKGGGLVFWTGVEERGTGLLVFIWRGCVCWIQGGKAGQGREVREVGWLGGAGC